MPLSEIELPERLCAEHISSSVNLKWSLTTETTGVATLKGISLSNAMLDLVTVAPLQWGKFDKILIEQYTNF